MHLEDPSLHYYVLYGVTYENDPAADTFPNENTSTESSESMKDIIAGLLARYFLMKITYICVPKETYLCCVNPFSGTADEILITLQEKALKFHSELLEEYSIWFCRNRSLLLLHQHMGILPTGERCCRVYQ